MGLDVRNEECGNTETLINPRNIPHRNWNNFHMFQSFPLCFHFTNIFGGFCRSKQDILRFQFGLWERVMEAFQLACYILKRHEFKYVFSVYNSLKFTGL